MENEGRASAGLTVAAKRAPKTPHKFFELIPPDTRIDFVRLAPIMIGVSIVAILIGLASIWFRGGLNYGIDFSGGTMVEVRFPNATSIGDVRAALARDDLHEVVVQRWVATARSSRCGCEGSTKGGNCRRAMRCVSR
jgi:hypothetical protein